MKTRIPARLVKYLKDNVACTFWLAVQLVAGSIFLIALVAANLLLPPLLVITTQMILDKRKELLNTIWPHDSGRTRTVIVFPAFVALATALGISYNLVGLFSTIMHSPLLVVLPIAIIIIICVFFKKLAIEIKELIVWVVKFQDRFVTIVSSLAYGFSEQMSRFVSRLVTLVVLIAPLSVLFILRPGDISLSTSNNISGHFFIAGVALASAFFILNIVLLVIKNINVRPQLWGDATPRLQAFTPSEVDGESSRIAHLSDLHIPWENRLTEDGRWDPDILSKCVASLDAEDKHSPLAALVFSGDITDTGHEESWKKFKKNFSKYDDRIVIAPGNHDLNIVGYGTSSIFLVSDQKNYAGRCKRMREFMDSASALMGQRAQVWNGSQLESLPAAWLRVASLNLHGKAWLDAACDLFPFIVSVKDSEMKFVVWNSVRTSGLALNNSYGDISSRQLLNFEAISKSLADNDKGGAPVHVMHHKIGLPVTKLKTKKLDNVVCIGEKIWLHMKHTFQIAGMTMLNAQQVAPQIMKADRTVVLHGHHHALFVGQLTRDNKVMHVVSAPSTTLGTEYFARYARRASYDILDLAPAQGGWALVKKPRPRRL